MAEKDEERSPQPEAEPAAEPGAEDRGAPEPAAAGAEATAAEAPEEGKEVQESAGEEPEAGGEEPDDEEPEGPPLEEVIADIDRLVAAAFVPEEAEARPPAAERPSPAATRRYLLFSLAGTRCAVDLGHMVELGGLPRVTPVPNVPGWVRGVTNLRGDILAVLDLPALLEMERPAAAVPSRLLVVRSRRQEMTTGLLADAVHGIADLAPDQLRPPAAPITDRIAPYLSGVVEHGGRLVAVLDLEALLAAPEVRQFEVA